MEHKFGGVQCRARRVVVAALLMSMSMASAQPQASPAKEVVTGTEIVFLGTGTPVPSPERQGPSLAIIVNGRPYLVDAGVGVVRQANAAYLAGIGALKVDGLTLAFITHLHSDHTMGLPDLIFTPWDAGKKIVPLELYGSTGVKAMADNLLKAWEQDIQIRIHGLEAEDPTGYKVNAHEIKPGLVYQDANVKVTAFPVEHGNWQEAYGYRFETPNKTIVISGDTRPSENVVKACNGCDVLIHEVYSGVGGTSQKSPEEWMKYMSAFHTSAEELGVVASKARAKTLIVTHYVRLGSSSQGEMLQAIQKGFHGAVMVARDLDVIAP